MKKNNQRTPSLSALSAELLIIAVLILTLIIPFPTPKQYFVLYSIDILLVLFFRPRIRTFIDLALISLFAMVFLVMQHQIYSTQKLGVFIFLLSINIIVTELRRPKSA